MATPRDFYRAFYDLTKFEIVGTPTENERHIRFIGRVRTRAVSKAWINQYVDALIDIPYVDVSRKYFRRDGEKIWAWRIIIQPPGAMAQALDEIIRALRLSARPVETAPVEVTEVPLVAPSSMRNMPVTATNGKGASPIRERT